MMTPHEVCELLRISRWTLRGLVRKGKLRRVEISRVRHLYHREEVEALLGGTPPVAPQEAVAGLVGPLPVQ
jgi:excisionase family DNA binding protein